MGKRLYSPTGIYHVMIRGNRKENIFESNEDRLFLLDLIRKVKNEINFILYAYCLMGNHDHLLIKELYPEEISKIMFEINNIYSKYFNKTYKLVGHVQQDRFKSEIIESEYYLINCLKYIHYNPVKANFISQMSEYNWSSHNIYMGKRDPFKIVDCNEFLKLLSNKTTYESLSNEKSYNVFLEPRDEHHNIRIETSKSLIDDYLNSVGMNIVTLCANKELRNNLILRLKRECRLSCKNIGLLLNLSESLVKTIN